MRDRQYGEAITAYKQALEIDPDHIDCIINLLISYTKSKDYGAFSEKAIEVLESSKCSLELKTSCH